MKKNIDISEIDALSLMGVGDQNIKVIQKNIDAQIVVRGNTIHLDGKKSEIALIESIYLVLQYPDFCHTLLNQ